MSVRFAGIILVLGCLSLGTWVVLDSRTAGSQGVAQPADLDITEPSAGVAAVVDHTAEPEPEIQQDDVQASEAPPAATLLVQIPPVERPVAGAVAGQPEVLRIAPPLPDAELWSYPQLLQQNASNNLFQARTKLASARSDVDRYLALGPVAKLEYVYGNVEGARTNAVELLVLDERFKNEPWRDGTAVHEGNFVLGRIAISEGLIEEAKQYLLEAGKSTGSPVLGSFGPNMSLARDLLIRGETEAVLNYFELCRKFWGSGEKQLADWATEVKAGRMPDFGANVYY